MEKEILRAEHITKSYGEKQVLNDINFSLKEGELVCLLGISGVGKTTLFNVLSGLTAPDEGKVLLASENGFTDITEKNGMLSYMLQKDLLLPHMHVVDNVALPLTLKGVPKKKARETASEYFKRFGLDGTQNKYPAQLSGGMRQEQRFSGHTFAGIRLPFWMNLFPHLIRLRKRPCRSGFWRLWMSLKCPRFLSHMTLMKPS